MSDKGMHLGGRPPDRTRSRMHREGFLVEKETHDAMVFLVKIKAAGSVRHAYELAAREFWRSVLEKNGVKLK